MTNEMIYGLGIPDLPPRWRAVGALVVVECVTDSGVRLRTASVGMTDWASLGMVRAAGRQLEQRLDISGSH